MIERLPKALGAGGCLLLGRVPGNRSSSQFSHQAAADELQCLWQVKLRKISSEIFLSTRIHLGVISKI